MDINNTQVPKAMLPFEKIKKAENKRQYVHFYMYDKYFARVLTAQDFYDKAAHGGIERPMANGKGHYTKMKDGSILSYREVSSSDGTPAVEINIKKSTNHGGIKYQKIHFVKGR
jgi:hypothetical protein